MELSFTPVQTLIVALIATLLTSLFTFLVEKGIPWFIAAVWKKPVEIDLGRFIKSLVVVIAALSLAAWWYPGTVPILPEFNGTAWEMVEQFFEWLPILGAAGLPFFGAATAIYNLLLGYITDPDRRIKALKVLLEWLFPGGLPLK